MKKDILFLCQFFYPEYVSSATLPYDTAVALKRSGFDVDVLCGYPHEYVDDAALPKKETVEGINIQRVKYIQMSRKGMLGRLINYFSFTFMMFLHLFKAARYRTVLVYSTPPILPWIASWAKVLFGTKLVFVAYDLYPEIAIRTDTFGENGVISRLMRHINKVVYKRADQVVALSSEMKEFIVNTHPISENRVTVIPNWYADQGALSQRGEGNSFAEVTKGRFVVSYFGNMGLAQDMQTIIDTIRKMKDNSDVCFLFAGHGNKKQKLTEFIEKEKITNAYMYDFLRGKDFQDALQISDCALVSLAKGLTGLCVPSKTYSYMMQGIPLLAIMDPCDIVSDIEAGAGKWVRNEDSDAMVANIRQMIQNPEKVKSMRDTCRQIFLEKYTTQICTGKYVTMFQKLL